MTVSTSESGPPQFILVDPSSQTTDHQCSSSSSRGNDQWTDNLCHSRRDLISAQRTRWLLLLLLWLARFQSSCSSSTGWHSYFCGNHRGMLHNHHNQPVRWSLSFSLAAMDWNGRLGLFCFCVLDKLLLWIKKKSVESIISIEKIFNVSSFVYFKRYKYIWK